MGVSVAAGPAARTLVGTSAVGSVGHDRAVALAWRWWANRLAVFIARAVAGMPSSSWLIVDLILLNSAVCAAYVLFPPVASLDVPHIALWQAMSVFGFVTLLSSLVFGLYERETIRARSRIVVRMLLTVLLAAVLAYAIIYVVMYSTVSRRVAGFSLTMFLTTGALLRLLAFFAIQRIPRGLLVVGSNGLFASFQRAQAEGFLREYRLLGYASHPGGLSSGMDRPHFLGAITDQIPRLRRNLVSDIVVGSDAARDPTVMEWIVPSMRAGCRVTTEATFYEKATGRILVEEIKPDWFLLADLKAHCDERATFKRLMDLCLAFVGLCVTAPLWPLIALAIKSCDGGPVFYLQDRVGHNGQVFRLYKFRTMRRDAENGKSVWASPNDPRVTVVGRWLRRTRLDELPQLVNVLAGHMSVVGPRPERPDIVTELTKQLPYYGERHLAKPGITGWAQISFRYGASVEDARRKLQFDLYYLKHLSLELDIIILLRTLGTFLRGAC